jgi:hypothetical protein
MRKTEKNAILHNQYSQTGPRSKSGRKLASCTCQCRRLQQATDPLALFQDPYLHTICCSRLNETVRRDSISSVREAGSCKLVWKLQLADRGQV